METSSNLNLTWILGDDLSKFILHSDIIIHEIYSIITDIIINEIYSIITDIIIHEIYSIITALLYTKSIPSLLHYYTRNIFHHYCISIIYSY